MNVQRLPYGELIELDIRGLDADARGISTYQGLDVQVPGVLPGDRVSASVVRQRRNVVVATPQTWLESSPLRQGSPCNHFPACGGCRFIDVPYSMQSQITANLFEQIVRESDPTIPIRPIIESKVFEYHRNTMEFSLFKEDGRIQIGLKERGRFDRCVETPNCRLFDDRWTLVHAWVSEQFNQLGLPIYNRETHMGTLRYLIVRKSELTKEWLVVVVVASDCGGVLTPFSEALRTQFPWISGGVMAVQSTPSDTAFTQDWRCLSGVYYLVDQIGGKYYRISPYSFFQTNTVQAGVLYETALRAADPSPTDRLLDLYCGAGTIGIYFSDHVKSVVGIEENPSAINDAGHNMMINQVQNMSVRLGRVKNILKFETFQADIVVVDPPRSGMEPKALRRMAAINAPKLVYVSCKPSTMMVDLNVLRGHGYTPQWIQPVDMFPHTPHLEAVALLLKD